MGRPLEVMVESLSTREGWVCGTDRRYVPVELPGTADDIGKICYGRGIQVHRQFLEAERANPDRTLMVRTIEVACGN